jgi:hypothetical protein
MRNRATLATVAALAGTAIALGTIAIAAGAWAQDRSEYEALSTTGADVNLLAVVPSATAGQLRQAIVRNNTAALCQVTSGLVTTNALQASVFGPPPIQGFPNDGVDFGLLSTGDAGNAPGAWTQFTSVTYAGARDAATLSFTFQIGGTPGNLTFDWKYGTEENPTFLNSVFQDPFNATLNPGATNLATIAVDTAGPISNGPIGGDSVNPTGPAPSPNDTQYNAVTTATQVVTHDLTALANGAITVVLDIRDATDDILDSAVFLDNLKIDGCDTVGIDIKAGSFPNSINLDKGGTIPIAILGSNVLDVTNIDPASVTLADAGVKLIGKPSDPKTQCSIQDVSGDFTFPEGDPDGFDDLVCHMNTFELGALDCSTTSANVTALYNGILITGSDSVNIVKDGVSCQP